MLQTINDHLGYPGLFGSHWAPLGLSGLFGSHWAPIGISGPFGLFWPMAGVAQSSSGLTEWPNIAAALPNGIKWSKWPRVAQLTQGYPDGPEFPK